MATLGNKYPNIINVLKRSKEGGEIAAVIELLQETNPVLDDIVWVEANGYSGHRTTIRTGYPDVVWRSNYEAVQPSKSTTAQVEDISAQLAAFSVLDPDLIPSDGRRAAYRMTESKGYLESMNNQVNAALFYSSTDSNPRAVHGLSPRFAFYDPSEDPAIGAPRQVLNAGGTGSDNASIWVIAWGDDTMHGFYPKGSMAGLQRKDHGIVLTDKNGAKIEEMVEGYKWNVGFSVRDYRYVSRIANISVGDLAGETAPDLTVLLTKAMHRIQNRDKPNIAIYMNRTVAEWLDIQSQIKGSSQVKQEMFGGKFINTFRGIPIRECDALLSTEELVPSI